MEDKKNQETQKPKKFEQIKHNFQKLTPIDTMDESMYSDALDYVFENDDLQNIAISGPYGSGKSSVINSYKKTKEDKKFVHISLANFEGTRYIPVEKIEAKIINELVHLVDASKIEQTNFKLKQKITSNEVKSITRLILMSVIYITYLLRFTEWTIAVNNIKMPFVKSILELTLTTEVALLMGAYLGWIAYNEIFKIIKSYKNKWELKELNIKGSTFSVGNKKDSLFNNYLEEIIYIIEQSDFDAIVFEDIDRYNKKEVFEHLRRINTLINLRVRERLVEKEENADIKYTVNIYYPLKVKIEKKEIEWKDKKSFNYIKFFYLIRDDMFSTGDRTKFFDFIIPVIPIINSSNSYNKMLELFENDKEIKDIIKQENILKDISWYVTDMRILKNIYNEFIIYYKTLRGIEVPSEKVLPLIVYKNLIPSDFAKLQINQGIVYELFNRIKEELTVKEKIRYIKEKDELLLNKQSIDNEKMKSLEEIVYIYAFKTGFSYNSNRDIEYLKDDVEKRLNQNNTYQKYLEEYNSRKEIIQKSIEGEQIKLDCKINEIDQIILDVELYQLKDLITRENIDDLFNDAFEKAGAKLDEEQKLLLKFLIREGYIDERYIDNIGYFHDNSLKNDDVIFIGSVRNKKKKGFNFKITNPDLIIKELRDTDFYEEEILNNILVSELVTSKENNKIENLFTQLKRKSNKKFIEQYLLSDKNKVDFVIKLSENWSEFFYEAYNDKTFNLIALREYVRMLLIHANEEDVGLANIDGELSKYVSNEKDLLAGEIEDDSKMFKNLIELKVKFHDLENAIDEYKTDKFDEKIYMENLYEINLKNIQYQLEKYIKFEKEDFIHRNYTQFFKAVGGYVFRYIEDNIDEYMEVNLDGCESKILDSEDVILKVVNHEVLDISLKERYLDYLETKVSSVEKIDNIKSLNLLLKYSVIDYTENNIIDVFVKGEDVSEELVHFINNSKIKLDLSKITTSYDNDTILKFIIKIISVKGILLNKFKEILEKSSAKFTISGGGIESDRMEYLIKNQNIIMNETSLECIRKDYSDLISNFIQENPFEYYMIIIDKQKISISELEMILESNLNYLKKIELLKLVKTPLSLKGKKYTNAIINYILEYNFELSDITELASNYSNYKEKTKELVFDKTLENIDEVINEIDSADIQLLKLLLDEEIEDDDKKYICAKLCETATSAEIVKYLSKLSEREFDGVFNSKVKPVVDDTEVNKLLLDQLKKRKFILGYKDGNDAFKITRNKRIFGIK